MSLIAIVACDPFSDEEIPDVNVAGALPARYFSILREPHGGLIVFVEDGICTISLSFKKLLRP